MRHISSAASKTINNALLLKTAKACLLERAEWSPEKLSLFCYVVDIAAILYEQLVISRTSFDALRKRRPDALGQCKVPMIWPTVREAPCRKVHII